LPTWLRNVLQHDLLGLPIHDDRAAGGQERKAELDIALQPAPRLRGESSQPSVEAELLSVVAHELQNRQDGLVASPPQPGAQLLQEKGCALGRSKEQHGVDVGQVEAFLHPTFDFSVGSACHEATA
jgi:hypothetical protein